VILHCFSALLEFEPGGCRYWQESRTQNQLKVTFTLQQIHSNLQRHSPIQIWTMTLQLV